MGNINRVVITDYYHKLITPRKVSLAIGYMVSLVLVAIATYLMTKLAIGGSIKVLLIILCIILMIVLIRELSSTFFRDWYIKNHETVDKLKDVYYLDDLSNSIELNELYMLSEFINKDESTKEELIIDIPIGMKPVTDENMQSIFVENAVLSLYMGTSDEELLEIIEDIYYKN